MQDGKMFVILQQQTYPASRKNSALRVSLFVNNFSGAALGRGSAVLLWCAAATVRHSPVELVDIRQAVSIHAEKNHGKITHNPIICIIFAPQSIAIISHYGNHNSKKTDLFPPEN